MSLTCCSSMDRKSEGNFLGADNNGATDTLCSLGIEKRQCFCEWPQAIALYSRLTILRWVLSPPECTKSEPWLILNLEKFTYTWLNVYYVHFVSKVYIRPTMRCFFPKGQRPCFLSWSEFVCLALHQSLNERSHHPKWTVLSGETSEKVCQFFLDSKTTFADDKQHQSQVALTHTSHIHPTEPSLTASSHSLFFRDAFNSAI